MDNYIKSKRICFVATLAVTLKAFVFPQAKYLLENGWDVTFICAEDENFHKELSKNINYIPLPIKRGIHFFDVPKIIFKLYKIFKNEHFDLVQYSTPNATFYAATAAWLAGIPVRLYAQWGIRYVGFNGLMRNIFKLIEIWCCYCSTIIEPDSLSNLEFSIKEGLYSRDKGHVIWNGSACGIDLERFNIFQKEKWRTEYREKLKCDSHNLIIGFVGSIRRDKGCNELIAACSSLFSEMPLTRLLLIGDKNFYGTIDKNLRDWIELSNQVIYVPPNNQIPQYMACMDIFVLPSYREGFGLVIIEAEAMGVPAVVSDVPGPIDAVKDKETGLVVPVRSASALAEALQILITDFDKRNFYSTEATSFARENFEQKEFLLHALADKEKLLAENILIK
jgi:glycosyltransferase involved in cell wall biosynthesis